MEHLLILIAAIVPGFIFLGYGIIKAHGSWRNRTIWRAFLIGMGTAVPVIILETLIQFILKHFTTVQGRALLNPFVVAGLCEEGFKFLALFFIVERLNIRRHQDIVLLAIGIGLGFATFENCLYLLFSHHWTNTAETRALTSVFAHGIFGIVMGCLFMLARADPANQRFWLALGLLLPMMLHGLFDMPLMYMAYLKTVPGHHAAAIGGMMMLWIVILIGTAILDIMLCNYVMPKAAALDRHLGLTTLAHSPMADHPVFYGTAMLVLSVSIGLLIGTHIGKLIWPGLLFATFPAALGIDLICTRHPRKIPVTVKTYSSARFR